MNSFFTTQVLRINGTRYANNFDQFYSMLA